MAKFIDPKSDGYKEKVRAQVEAALFGESEPADKSDKPKESTPEPKEPASEPKEPTNKSSKWSKSFKLKDDFGDEVDFEVDEDALPTVAEKAFKHDTLTAELRALQDEIKSLRVERDATINKAKKWLDLENTGNKQAMIDEILKDEGGIEGLRSKAIEEFKQYSSLSDEERRDFDFKRSQAENTRRIEEVRKQMEAKIKEADEREARAKHQEYVSTMRTVANRYFIPNKDKDERVTSVNEAIFNKAKAIIDSKRAEKVVITEAIMDRAFNKAASLLKGSAKEVQMEVAKQNAAQSDASTAAAQSVKSSNKGSESADETLNRWARMVREGKLREVTKEAGKSEESLALYEKLASKLSKK